MYNTCQSCVVKSFRVIRYPIVNDIEGLYAKFDIEASFMDNPKKGYNAECCEYRQEVKGVLEEPIGTPKYLRIYKGYMQADSYGDIEEDGPTPYGHRKISPIINWDSWSYYGMTEYKDRDRKSSMLRASFRGRIIDTCKGRGDSKKEWVTAENKGRPLEWGPILLFHAR